jgi:hypothetical protein
MMMAWLLEPKPAQLTGPLSQASLVQVLRAVFVHGLSGHLVLARGDETLSLRFLSGHVVSGSSEPVPGRLGEVLARAGVLERAQLDPALARAARHGRRLGPVLVEQGLATREQVEEALRLQVCSVLSDALSWGSGSFRFEPNDGSLPPLEEVSLRISTAQLILQAINSLEASAGRELLGDPDRLVSAVKDPPVRLEAMTLSPADAFVLSRADGDLTARELLGITPLPPEAVERSLLALLSLGVVEYRPRHSRPSSPRTGSTSQTVARPPEPVGAAIPVRPAEEKPHRLQEIDSIFAGLSGKSHQDVLGVAPGASVDEVRKAYQRLATRFHPDAVGDVPPEEAAKAKAIFMRVSEAYCAVRSALPRLSQAPRPPAQEPPQDPAPVLSGVPIAAPQPPPAPELPPDESLRLAAEALAERPWEALGILESLVPRTTGTIRCRARLLRARAMLKNPASLRAGEVELREIVEEDPGCADAWLALGGFYKDRGLGVRAASMFRKVLEIRPGNPRATAELRASSGSEGAPHRSSKPRVARV